MYQTPDASGTSLTRYLTHALTPDEFAADGISENLRQVYYNRTGVVMRGYKPSLLSNVLLGRMKDGPDYGYKLQKMNRGFQSIIQPFVTMPVEDVVNTDSFQVVDGTNAGVAEDYQWKIKVQNGPADFQNSALPAINTQFVEGDTISVFYVASDGSAQNPQFQIISSTDATVGNTPAAWVIVQAPFNQTQWDALTGPEQAVYQPIGGATFFTGNTTSNYRSRAVQKGLYNPNSIENYWFTTDRKTFTYSDAYEEANAAETMTEFAKAFALLPLGQQIKLLDQDHERSVGNKLFWERPFAGQDVNTWQQSGQLPVVYDIDGTTIMDVETRLKGIETQLEECGRVLDFYGAAFNWNTVGPMLYQVSRNRAATGANLDASQEIDMLSNRFTNADLKKAIAAYYGDSYRIQYQQQVGKSAQETFSRTSGIWSQQFDLDDFNITLNTISATFMEDLLSMTPTAHKGATRYAMFVDFSDIDWFVMEAKSRETTWPPKTVPIDFTRAVIDYNMRHVRMESMTHGIAVRRPSRHLIVKNFSNSCAVMPVPNSCSYE